MDESVGKPEVGKPKVGKPEVGKPEVGKPEDDFTHTTWHRVDNLMHGLRTPFIDDKVLKHWNKFLDLLREDANHVPLSHCDCDKQYISSEAHTKADSTREANTVLGHAPIFKTPWENSIIQQYRQRMLPLCIAGICKYYPFAYYDTTPVHCNYFSFTCFKDVIFSAAMWGYTTVEAKARLKALWNQLHVFNNRVSRQSLEMF